MFLLERPWKLASVKFWLNWGFTLVRWKRIWVYYLSSVFYFTSAAKFPEIQDIRRLGEVCNDIIIVSGFYCAFFLNSLWCHNVLFISVHGISCLKIPNLVQSFSQVRLFETPWTSMPGFLVHHQLLELAQTHAHQVGDAIQPSHPLSSPSPPVFNLSQHQGLFQWVSSLHQVAKILELQLQRQSF